jgi:nucleoside-diphosphate-sugar epimerase
MSWHLWNVNVASALKFAEASRKAAVKKFIYASTGNVYANSFDPLSENSPLRRDNCYSLSKIHAEEALLLYNDYFDLSLLRIFGIYGYQQSGKLIPNLYNSIKQGKTIFLGTNPNDQDDVSGLKISLCFIDDIVRIISDLLKVSKIPILNIAGEQIISVREIASSICNHLKLPFNCELTDKPRQFDLIADISLLKSIVKPTFTSFESGLKKTLESYDS